MQLVLYRSHPADIELWIVLVHAQTDTLVILTLTKIKTCNDILKSVPAIPTSKKLKYLCITWVHVHAQVLYYYFI
jgi:hypothetical protein